MIPRTAAATLSRLAQAYPVLVLTGPRQSGKTTLARTLFADKSYVSLESPDERQFSAEDPKGFLARFPKGAIIDEAQHCPDLFSYIQTRVDLDGRMGLFVLTGSQNFQLLAKVTPQVTQSLAGRAGIVQLLPFSLAELAVAGRLPDSLDKVLWQGLYPPLYDRPLDAAWYGGYVMTYLERDVRQLANVHDLNLFQRFLRLCAARTGQLLNLSNLATETGISSNTARNWLSILEASYLVHLLPPHHRNLGKRVVKTPKLYFLDPGLAGFLMGIQNAGQLNLHPHRGALFETLVVAEFLKRRYNAGLPSNLFFWRDNLGTEVDLLLDQGLRLDPVEIKSGQTFTREMVGGLEKWLRYAGEEAGMARLIYGGDESYRRLGVEVGSWRDIGAGLPQEPPD